MTCVSKEIQAKYRIPVHNRRDVLTGQPEVGSFLGVIRILGKIKKELNSREVRGARGTRFGKAWNERSAASH
jgi:hypothetical protein